MRPVYLLGTSEAMKLHPGSGLFNNRRKQWASAGSRRIDRWPSGPEAKCEHAPKRQARHPAIFSQAGECDLLRRSVRTRSGLEPRRCFCSRSGPASRGLGTYLHSESGGAGYRAGRNRSPLRGGRGNGNPIYESFGGIETATDDSHRQFGRSSKPDRGCLASSHTRKTEIY